MSTRKRGRYEESDTRYLSEINKRLKRKMASLLRENGRLKKERDRWKGYTDIIDEVDAEVMQPPPLPPAPALETTICPACGATKAEIFSLNVRGEERRYWACHNAPCRRRGRLP